MKIDKNNCMEVAQWLLQCGPEDFTGPLEPIEEWFEALGDVCSYYYRNTATSTALACAERKQATVLAQLLFQHLNNSARLYVQQQLTVQSRYDNAATARKEKAYA